MDYGFMTVRTAQAEVSSTAAPTRTRVAPKIVKAGSHSSSTHQDNVPNTTPTRVQPKVVKAGSATPLNKPGSANKPLVTNPAPTRVQPKVGKPQSAPPSGVFNTSIPPKFTRQSPQASTAKSPATLPTPTAKAPTPRTPAVKPRTVTPARATAPLRAPYTSPQEDGGEDIFSSILGAPEADEETVNPPSAYLPRFDANPMFALSRLQSGIGVITVSLESQIEHHLEVFIEDNEGNHEMIRRNFQVQRGILLAKDGSVSIDLHDAAHLKRISVVASGTIDGTLVVKSDDMDWQKNTPIKNADSGILPVSMAFLCDGMILFRSGRDRHPNMRAFAKAQAFHSIPWRDDSTPLS